MKLVIQNTSKVWGGNEKWLATLADGLATRGHEVVVSCAMGAVQRELSLRGVRTSPFRPRGTIDFVSGLAFAAWLARQKADVLLLTSWRPTAWAVFAARVAGVNRIALRLGIVRDFPRRTPKAIALRRVHALIVNSEEIRNTWIGSAPAFPPESVHIVLNGVRSRLSEKPVNRQRLREELGLGHHTILVGGAGHIAPRKGFDVLLRAFATAKLADSHLAILGDGEQRTGLERLAAELGLGGRVHWLGHRNDGAGVIGGLDLFVLSSHNEGMANVMLEAMAGGTPVIAGDISGVRQGIAAHSNRPPAGWTVLAGDVTGFAAAINSVGQSLRTDPAAVEQRIAEAHWRVENWFSPERMVMECESILFARA